MIKALSTTWPLFFGYALLMIGNGLQSTLLGLRASIENFDPAAIGLVMSLYYVGYLLGSIYTPKLMKKVGHIRVFTAMASLASITVLFHGMFLDVWVWSVVRMITGFAFAGLYIVAESWLNDVSTNKTRGSLYALYQVTGYGSMVLGQFALNIAAPESMTLFLMTSILVSFALLPISLSSRPAPKFDEPEPISIKKLYATSPLGLMGVFLIGIAAGTFFSIGSVYATTIGMTIPQISTFMALFILGGALCQFPVGYLSDKLDRRKVLIGVAFFSFLMAFVCMFFSSNSLALNICVFIYGGISLCTYGLSVAHINDHLSKQQYVSASARAILINGAGAAIGPFVISVFLSFFGAIYFFPLLGLTFLMLFLYGVYRTTKRDSVPLEEQGEFSSMLIPSTPLTMAIIEESAAHMKDMEEKKE